MRLTRFVLSFLFAVSSLASLRAASSRAAEEIRFNRDIRPILSDNCFRCHGSDKNARKAKLRLDHRDVAIDKGAIVPGKPDESELIRRIFTADEDDVMPPPDSHKKLTDPQKELLKRWIAQGAKYEPHWAFIMPIRPTVPKVQSSRFKVQSPIDAFVLTQLEANKIKPSHEADHRTLLRRVSLDLTGLPPTAEEIAAFEKDKSKDAYEKQVDRLLASPHFGERMAVPWLDVVRFADTVGYHGDQNVNVFPYRDYVIDAFNQNKPFDQFTIEQLAGDLLPNNTIEQRIATGFNRLNMVTREGGAQPKEYLAKYGADRVRTVGMTWLGLTVGCAECHDHKFDPFTTKDFYQIKAFFADVRQWGVYQDYKYTPNPDLKNWSNDHPFPPEEVVESPYLQQRIERLRMEVGALAHVFSAKQGAEFDAWRNSTKALLAKNLEGWISPTPVVQVFTNITVLTNTTKLTNVVVATEETEAITNITEVVALKTNTAVATNFVVQADGSLIFGSEGDANLLPLQLEGGWLAAIRLELLPHEKHGGDIFRSGNRSASMHLSASLKHANATNEAKLSFYHADADHKEARYANGYEVIGIKDTWKVSASHAKEKQTGVWLLDPPVEVRDGDQLVLKFNTNVIGAMRVSVTPVPTVAAPRESAAIAPGKSPALLRNATTTALEWFIGTAPDAEAWKEYRKLHREVLECRDGNSPTVVTVSWKPETTRVLPRGNWQSDDGEIVQPLAPHFLPQPKRDGTNALSRLDLAKWIVSPENPLTARTVVNRFWKQFFGSGLANPVDDLGLQGDPPSHPELLDWLACEFMQPGVPPASRWQSESRPDAGGTHSWDVKHIIRLIVTSSTYKQSSKLRPELRDIDPNNRLLASQNPRRLDAEFVRDNALAIAGLLNRDIGGPSAFPYQPARYYENLQFPDRDYHASKDERQYRRGVYAHWQRTFLQPMLANFDAPSREECNAYRLPSNTPQQALTLLNDPGLVEAARVWAARLLQTRAKSDDERLDLAYQRALGRSIKPKERASLKRFLAAQREHLQNEPDEAVKILKIGFAPAAKDLDVIELGAWTSLCRVILNLHETITVY